MFVLTVSPKYIRTLTFNGPSIRIYSYPICIQISNIRPKIFEYSNIFEDLLCTACRILASYLLLIASYFLLLATCFLLLATYYLLLASCYLLVAKCYLHLATFKLLLTACDLLHFDVRPDWSRIKVNILIHWNHSS